MRQARTIDELYRIAEDFREVGIDVLAISGGDGTNHVTLTGFIDVYRGATMPQVALLRGGTMNTVANSVGVRRGRPDGLLGRLVRAYAQRGALELENVERHVMRIGPRGSEKCQYGFLFGTGVVHGFLSEYYRRGEPSPLTALQTLTRGIGSALVRGRTIRRMARPFQGSVTIDDGTSETSETRWGPRNFLAVAAGTISHIGLQFKPFHRYAERPETFHLLGIHASPLSFVRELPRIHRAQALRAGKAFEALPRRAILAGVDGRVEYMIDGDLDEVRGELEISIGPRVRLVVLR
jgi:diacylglycerol kinase family enzyme